MKLLVNILIIFTLLLSACGEWPDVVKNKKDIDKLSKDTTIVRVRFLPDSDIMYLTKLKKLRHVDFSGGWGTGEAAITDRGVMDLANLGLEHLKTIDLGHNSNITNKSLQYIATIKSVEELLLFDCKNLTDDGLLYIQDMPNLKYIDVSDCEGITEKGLNLLSKRKDIQIRK